MRRTRGDDNDDAHLVPDKKDLSNKTPSSSRPNFIDERSTVTTHGDFMEDEKRYHLRQGRGNILSCHCQFNVNVTVLPSPRAHIPDFCRLA